MLEIKDFIYHSRTRVLLDNINITVSSGEILALIGPSGCGKSRLLRSIIGLDDCYEGTIDTHDAKVGMVFQDFNLFTHLTAVENVMSSMVHIEGKKTDAAYDEAMNLLRSVGMADKAFLYPDNLSGGEKQRVTIARALARDPDIILFDDPTSNLDPVMLGEIEAVIRQVAAGGKTIILVTSELSLISDLCTRVIFLSDGKVIEEGTPSEIIDSPKHPETKRFINGLQILAFDIDSKNYDFFSIQTKIREYGIHYDIDRSLILRIQAIMEEMLQIAVILPKTDTKMQSVIEYSKQDKELTCTFMCSGDIDFKSDDNMISWLLIKRNASSLTHDKINDEHYTDKVIVSVKM